MFQTKNSLPEKIRQNAINLLQSRVAEGIDLIQQAKHAHWNVKGPNFIALHELFDKVHEEVESSVDLLAERIAQFGGIAEGTCKAAAKRSELPDYPLTTTEGDEHVEALSRSLASFGESIREGIEQATQWKDAGTADILTEVSRTIDKNLWFVEAHQPSQSRGEARNRGAA